MWLSIFCNDMLTMYSETFLVHKTFQNISDEANNFISRCHFRRQGSADHSLTCLLPSVFSTGEVMASSFITDQRLALLPFRREEPVEEWLTPAKLREWYSVGLSGAPCCSHAEWPLFLGVRFWQAGFWPLSDGLKFKGMSGNSLGPG